MIEKYIPPQIPQDLVEQFKNGLAARKRWIRAATPPTRFENDLEHTEGTLEIVDEIEQFFPSLASVLNLRSVRRQLTVHDIGEIFVPDLARSDPDYDRIKPRRKRREKAAARLIFYRYIPDVQIRREVSATYWQYTQHRPDDPDSLFANLDDKIQAIRFGVENVYNNPVASRDKRLRHAAFSIDLVFQFANPLLDYLSREGKVEAKEDLVKFLQLEFGRYIQAGFPELAREARHRLFSENPDESTLPF